MWFWKQHRRHVREGLSPLGVVVGTPSATELRQERRKAKTMQTNASGAGKHVPTRWLLFWSVSSSFSNHSPLPGEFPHPWHSPFPCPLFVEMQLRKGSSGFFTASAAFALAVPPHSGCFIQKTWTNSRLTPVCFHSDSVSTLLPTSYVEAAEIERKKYKHHELICLFLFPFVSFYSEFWKCCSMPQEDKSERLFQ